jgi:hypothetical protein
MNVTEVGAALQYVADNYEKEVQSVRNGQFFNYVTVC